MAAAYEITGSLDEFALAREQFALLVAHLQSQETGQLEHGEVEAYLSREGTEEAERWVQERALRILQGNASYVAAGMRRSAALRGLSACQRANVDKCADYLLKYREMLRYDECLQRGLPIATGVVEGACRHLVKDRLDITGAR